MQYFVMRGLSQPLAVLLLLAAAGACSPRLRRRFHDLESGASRELAELETGAVANTDLVGANDDEQYAANIRKEDRSTRVSRSRAHSGHSGHSGTALRRRSPPSTQDEEQQQVDDGDLQDLIGQAASSPGGFDPATFNPTPFEENTPEWNMAMINLLLQMKAKGHKVNEIQINKPLAELQREMAASNSNVVAPGVSLAGPVGGEPLVCKTAPYNICYRLDKNGVLHPLGDRRPVRILRVYK